jgi:hypothetical protein
MKNLFKLFSPFKIVLVFFLLMAVQVQAISIKFLVDMSYQINNGSFNSSTDKVYLRGTFNNWDLSNQMLSEGNGVYSLTLALQANGWYQFKYFTDASGFPNGGYEANVGIAQDVRSMSLGSKDLVLAKLYFNNANLILRKTTPYFYLYCADSDLNILDTMASNLEANLNRVTKALESTIGSRVKVWIYPDQKSYFISYGYPDSPDWAVGSAIGKSDILLVSPNVLGYLQGQLDVAVHEFTHIVVAWKTISGVPNWLNESAATFLSSETLGARNLKSSIQSLGRDPVLSDFANGTFWSDKNGYGFAYSIADFIISTRGIHDYASFLENVNYSLIGYNSELEFQTAWQKFLDDFHLAPQVNVTYTVDLSNYIIKGLFNPAADKVYLGGPFSSWYPYLMSSSVYGIYTITFPSQLSKEYDYKFKISTDSAANGGWEDNVGMGVNGSRVIQTPASAADGILYFHQFNNFVLNKTLTLDTTKIPSKVYPKQKLDISWISQNINKINLSLSTNNGTQWSNIASNLDASTGKYNWTVPAFQSTQCLIRVADASNSSLSYTTPSKFSILSLELISPAGGENWTVATKHMIVWDEYVVDNKALYYSTNNGTNWLKIVDNIDTSTNSYDWTIPNTPSQNCLVAVQLKSTLAFIKNPLVFTISAVSGVETSPKPLSFCMQQNYPNPFNPSTSVKYQIPEKGFVNLKVYDLIGKELATLVNETKNAGFYEVHFDASELPSGIYIYQIRSNNFISTKKMMLIK